MYSNVGIGILRQVEVVLVLLLRLETLLSRASRGGGQARPCERCRVVLRVTFYVLFPRRL